MNEMDAFEKLARSARAQPHPPVDVAEEVLRAIAAGQPRPGRSAFWAAAAVASAAAVVTTILAVRTWLNWHDPLREIFSPLTMVMR